VFIQRPFLYKLCATTAAAVLLSPAFCWAQARGAPPAGNQPAQPQAQTQPGAAPAPGTGNPTQQNTPTGAQAAPGQPLNPVGQGNPSVTQPGQGFPNAAFPTQGGPNTGINQQGFPGAFNPAPGTTPTAFPGGIGAFPAGGQSPLNTNFQTVGNPAFGTPFNMGFNGFNGFNGVPTNFMGGFSGIPVPVTVNGTPNNPTGLMGNPNGLNGLNGTLPFTGTQGVIPAGYVGGQTGIYGVGTQGMMVNPMGMMTNVPAMPAMGPALIDIRVPAEAEVFIQGQRLNQGGPLRRFLSPTLDPSSAQSYEIQAVWTQDGRKVGTSQRVFVQAGDHKSVLFLSGDPLPEEGRR